MEHRARKVSRSTCVCPRAARGHPTSSRQSRSFLAHQEQALQQVWISSLLICCGPASVSSYPLEHQDRCRSTQDSSRWQGPDPMLNVGWNSSSCTRTYRGLVLLEQNRWTTVSTALTSAQYIVLVGSTCTSVLLLLAECALCLKPV